MMEDDNYCIIILKDELTIFCEWFNNIWKTDIVDIIESYPLDQFQFIKLSVNYHVLLQIQESCIEDLNIFCKIRQINFTNN